MSSNSGVACGFAGARGAQYAKVLVPLLSRMFGNQDGSHSLASSSTALSIFGCHPQFLTPSSLLKLLLIGAFSTALLAHRRIIKLAFASVTIGVAAYGSFRRIRYPDYSATVASKHVVGALISSSTGPAAVIIMSRRERFPLSMVT